MVSNMVVYATILWVLAPTFRWEVVGKRQTGS